MIDSRKLAALLLLTLTAASLSSRTASAQAPPVADPLQPNVFYGETPAAPADGPVIVFVHGINGVASDWWLPPNDMYALAFRAGYRTAFVSLSPDNRRNNASIIENGTVFHFALPAVIGHFKTSRVYIVAHSKGGIDVQAALTDAPTSLQVRAVFTVGTPHQGTELADWAFGAGQAQAAPLGLVTPATAALTTPRMQLFRQFADGPSFLNGVPYYTISGSSYSVPPNPLTASTGPVLSALTRGQPNDGIVIVPRSKLPTFYSTDLGTVPVNHFALALGSFVFPRINAQIRAIEADNEFKAIATEGFALDGAGRPLPGDRQNSFPWSMQWFKGKLYVGTGRAFSCVTAQTADVVNNTHDYPGLDPDVECSADPTDLPLAAEVWQFTPETGAWVRVYQSPVDVPIEFDAQGRGTKFTARDIAYRGMAVFKENGSGVERLYIGGISASSLFERLPGYAGAGGRRFPPPRLLWTDDGATFQAVAQTPGTFLGDLGVQTETVNKRGFRSFATLRDRTGVNRLFVTVSDLRGVGRVIASSNPSAGDNAWRQVSPSADVLPIFTISVYRNQLYATVGESWYPNGYAVFKTDAETLDSTDPTRYLFRPVVVGDGMQLLRARGAISMQEFQGRLYIGTDRPTELIRINPDDSWDLVAGPPRMTVSGFKWPLSGILGKGFNNPFNGHFYSMAVHDGTLYLGTWDWSQLMEHSSLGPLFKSSYGFDFLKSRDGVHWTVIDRNGLGDPHNSSIRNIVSTPFGLFVGATNPQFGLQIFQSTASLDLNKDGVIDQRDVTIVTLARNQRAVLPFDARDLDGDGVVTVNDARKLATQCTRPLCAQASPNQPPVVTNLTSTTDYVNGVRVHLSWTSATGAVRYHVYRADPQSVDTLLPPDAPIALPDGTTITFQQLKDRLLTGLCQDLSALNGLCNYADAFLSGTFASRAYHWIGSSLDPAYLDATPPNPGQSLYYVAAEDAAGRISAPSNTVAAPDQPDAPLLAQLGDGILRLRSSLGDDATVALGLQVSTLADAVSRWQLETADVTLSAIDETLRAGEAKQARSEDLPAARRIASVVGQYLKEAAGNHLSQDTVRAALLGDSAMETPAPRPGDRVSR